MENVVYNQPNTRARVEARRRLRKSHGSLQEIQGRQRPIGNESPFPIHKPIVKPLLKTRQQMLLSPTARKIQRKRQERLGSRVKPGPKRILMDMVHTGKLISLITFLVTIMGMVYLFTSSRFTVQQIQVEGNDLVDQDTIMELSGLRNSSLWLIDHDAVRQQLQQNSYIQDVKIEVAFPNHVTLYVIERKPDVRWQVGSTQYLVDGNGMVLEMVHNIPVSDTLVIEDTTHQFLQSRDMVDPDALKLAQALFVRLPEEIRVHPKTIGWNFGLGVYIKTSHGQMIVFGQSTNLDRKLGILGQLLKEKTKFTYLDLRPANPFYRNKPQLESDSNQPTT